MLDSLTKKQKIFFFIILGIMIIIIFYYLYSTLYLNDINNIYEENRLIVNDLLEQNNDVHTSEASENNVIVVYICGAVKKSAVISLKENSRICDAIDAVGGLTENADLTNINLAYVLEDGEKIYIPEKGEIIENYISTSFNNSNNKININKASQVELETIPGIGPSTALKIINYRNENGKFSKIEDIKNISGIGEAKFNNIKEYLSVK